MREGGEASRNQRKEGLISVVFTCKGRPELTEICLTRLIDLMPPPYDLHIAYDGHDESYEQMLVNSTNFYNNKNKVRIVEGYGRRNSRFTLINDALEPAEGPYFMHVENDFYWMDPLCLDSALKAFTDYPGIDFIRFEQLPFTQNIFEKHAQSIDRDILWMRKDAPYRFNFNPHIRKFKYPGGVPFKDEGFTRQPEQHHNDLYDGVSCCMTGDNFRHLGLFDESGHFKPYYSERFFNRRGKHTASKEEVLEEFRRIADASERRCQYIRLFEAYLDQKSFIP